MHEHVPLQSMPVYIRWFVGFRMGNQILGESLGNLFLWGRLKQIQPRLVYHFLLVFYFVYPYMELSWNRDSPKSSSISNHGIFHGRKPPWNVHCCGIAVAGAFRILRSPNLIHWEPCGQARRLGGNPPSYSTCHGAFHGHGGTPIAGWFVMEDAIKNGWYMEVSLFFRKAP